MVGTCAGYFKFSDVEGENAAELCDLSNTQLRLGSPTETLNLMLKHDIHCYKKCLSARGEGTNYYKYSNISSEARLSLLIQYYNRTAYFL
jgi:hypothetical protein